MASSEHRVINGGQGQRHVGIGHLAALHKIQCPALIICGDHDLISISHTVLIYQNIPHANLWVVPNSGHATLIEHADEFNSKCEEFFSSAFVDHQ